jgi:hypothetical protein
MAAGQKKISKTMKRATLKELWGGTAVVPEEVEEGPKFETTAAGTE